nr:histidine kinase [Tessaracoccus bendigoensis]
MTKRPPTTPRQRVASGRFSRSLVRGSGGISRRLLADTRSMVETMRLVSYALVESVTLLRWLVATIASVLGLGTVRGSFKAMQRNANRQRAWASKRSHRALTTSYRAEIQPHTRRGLGELTAELEDDSRARDLDWHLFNPVATLLGAAVPGALVTNGLWLVSIPFQLWRNGSVYYFRHYIDYWYALNAAPPAFAAGIVCLALTPISARLVQRLHTRWVGYMLASAQDPSLEMRVATLAESRRTALELQEAEIRRIERDLHDGAQARLVTMGMTLTQVSRLIEVDPSAAQTLLNDAKDDSSAALADLRSLVRGIRPPILADRGLAEALRSLAAGSPIDTEVSNRLNGRLLPTLETTLYFAIAELLANAVKHSAASMIYIELTCDRDTITATVTDNGIGGAEETADGGLSGLRRRLGVFDATLEFVSPVGGPTVVTVRVPRPVE